MDVKIFRVKGRLTQPNYVMPFSKDVRALKMQDAIEKVYTDFGSRHRVKRVHLRIASVEEISLEETTDSIIHELSEE